MTDDDKLTPADDDIAESGAFALLFSGKKRVHDSEARGYAVMSSLTRWLRRWRQRDDLHLFKAAAHALR
jgi:hypothetical protein